MQKGEDRESLERSLGPPRAGKKYLGQQLPFRLPQEQSGGSREVMPGVRWCVTSLLHEEG